MNDRSWVGLLGLQEVKLGALLLATKVTLRYENLGT
jgi:hypothetical protein